MFSLVLLSDPDPPRLEVKSLVFSQRDDRPFQIHVLWLFDSTPGLSQDIYASFNVVSLMVLCLCVIWMIS